MLHPSTKRLIDKLSEMTRKQRVTWTEGEGASVVHDTEGYRVIITPEPHAVLLTDALGREIETCRPEEFADETDAHGRPYAKFVAELYREASRHARGTEKAIRTLLAGLDAVEPEPVAPPVSAAPARVLIDAPDATTDETTTIESETEITAAVANLADQINAAPQEPVAEEPVIMAAPEPQPEPQPEPEPEPAPAPEPEPAVIAAAPEPLPEPVAVQAPEPQLAPAPAPQPEPEPAPQVTAEAAPEPEEIVPAAEEPGSFGTFAPFEQTAAPTPEPAPEPLAETAAPAPEPVREPEPAAAPAPEPAAEPVRPIPTLSQPISLSSIPFGFGLGAAQRVGTPSHPSTSAPEPAAQPEESTPRRIVIDGTLDLPDITPDELGSMSASDDYPPPPPKADPLDLPADGPSPAPEPANPRRFNPWN
jgi:hypothetical protein